MDNFVDLSNVPMKGDLKDWRSCDNTPVDFCYRDNRGTLYIVKHLGGVTLLVSYDGKTYEMNKNSVVNCQLGKLFNFSTKDSYRYDVGDIIKSNNADLKVLEKIRMNKRNVKGYKLQCETCGHVFNNIEANILSRNDGCPVCSKHVVKRGVNDLWTTNPRVASWLADPELGYTVAEFSNKYVEFVCPECGHSVGTKRISHVSTHGVMCNKCNDGVSYPNKLMSNLLNSLGVAYENEVGFPWCKFPKFKNPEETSTGRYDFVLEQYKLIIEMDGGLGHGMEPKSNWDWTAEELVYRDDMKTRLAIENGYTLVRIDCKYTGVSNKLEYCKNSILNSELINYIDFSDVNWEYIDSLSQKSYIVKACDMHKSGMSVDDIATELKKNPSTVYDYLHKGEDLRMV